MSHIASVDSKLCLPNVINIVLSDEKQFPNTEVDADWQFESVLINLLINLFIYWLVGWLFKCI